MTILKERKFAVPVTAVVCVLFLLLGVGTGLRREVSDLDQMYQTGVDGSGYGIATDLQQRYTYAGNLTAVAQKYEGAFDTQIAEVSETRAALYAAMATEGYSDDFAANTALTDAVEILNEAMKSYELSEEDEAYRAELYSNLNSRNDTIRHAATDFNAQVQNFNENILGGFPANVLHSLVGVDSVEVFG